MMKMPWNQNISRRALLQLGASTAAILALPSPFRRRAEAAVAPHFMVTFLADGGWDVTQVFDVHDPLDSTDGVDVDVPGQPVSQIATVGGITYMSNPTTRPTVDAFFNTWANRTAVVNGINTRSTSHDQSKQLVLTGYLDPTRADFAVMAAHHNGADLPLPHLLLSGPSFAGPYAGLSGRFGGALGTALSYNRIPGHVNPDSYQLNVSKTSESYIQTAIETDRQLSGGMAVSGRLDQYEDATGRADKLVRLASSLPRNSNNGTQLASSLAAAFRAGLTTSVTVDTSGGFDTHSNNDQQASRYEDLFGFLNDFLAGLAAEPGFAAASLLDETTIAYVSDFARTPELNGDNGKDHHPWTSMLLVGKRVRPGVSLGMTDGNQEGVKVNYSTGRPDDTGQVLDVTNVVAGVLTLVGANPSQYLPAGVKPFTAMVNA
jgi:uncharacterized protein (DUF1501 family)